MQGRIHFENKRARANEDSLALSQILSLAPRKEADGTRVSVAYKRDVKIQQKHVPQSFSFKIMRIRVKRRFFGDTGAVESALEFERKVSGSITCTGLYGILYFISYYWPIQTHGSTHGVATVRCQWLLTLKSVYYITFLTIF